MYKETKLDRPIDFLLGIGGLLYQIYLKVGLLKKPLLLYKRRIVVVCLLAWLPLFFLSFIGGIAFSGVRVPFIHDIDVHVRFLVCLALLIYAEVIVNDTLNPIVQQFTKCNIVASQDKEKFNAFIASAMRLTRSIWPEVLLIILVVTVGLWISKNLFSFSVSTWYESHGKLTLAGYWYAFVSLPLFQFILLRWYYRIAIWYRFLWQVSRLPLQLNSLHPDRAGGVGFLATSMYAFLIILLAHTILLSGIIFNHILNEGATLGQFQGEIITILLFLIILPMFPLLFFTDSLIITKQAGTLAYDATANLYVNEFHNKWIDEKSQNPEPLLGTSDIQALADLGNSFEVTSQMRVTPFNKNILISIALLIVLPLIPLIFTQIPIEKVLSQTMGFIFK